MSHRFIFWRGTRHALAYGRKTFLSQIGEPIGRNAPPALRRFRLDLHSDSEPPGQSLVDFTRVSSSFEMIVRCVSGASLVARVLMIFSTHKKPPAGSKGEHGLTITIMTRNACGPCVWKAGVCSMIFAPSFVYFFIAPVMALGGVVSPVGARGFNDVLICVKK